jgi:Protein of unknown function (DUF3775)
MPDPKRPDSATEPATDSGPAGAGRTTPATSAPETRAPAPEPGAPAPTPAVPAGTAPDAEAPELAIPVDTVGWIILKAREYDMNEPGDIESGEADGDNPLGVLEDRADDPTAAELASWIADLNETEQAELVALMWLGRGDDELENWAQLVEQARGSQTQGTGRGRRTAHYLLGTPQLGDYLEEGLERLGVDTANLEGTLR